MARVQVVDGIRAARWAGAYIAAALLLAACGRSTPALPAAPIAPAAEPAGDAQAQRAQATLQAALAVTAAGGAPAAPTAVPTEQPVVPPAPTATPSNTPSAAPTETRTATPTDTPTETPAETAIAMPTATPTATPSDTPPAAQPDAAATAAAITAVAGLVQTSVAATLEAQAAATSAAAEAASAVETAVAATLTAAAPPPTSTPRPTPRPTSTPRPAQSAPAGGAWAPRLAYSYGDVRDADVRVYDPATGADWAAADRGCDETEPGWAADGRTIFFQSDCGDGYDIFFVDADAAARGAAAPAYFYGGPCDEREPDASPDGRTLAFRLSCGDDTFNVDGALHLLDLRTGAASDLGLAGRSPVWSPDGTRLAYMSERSGGWEVYVYDLVRGRETRVTDCADSCRFPAWSPDGALILVVESTPDVADEERTAWTVRADGSGSRRRLFSAHNLGRPSWSAEGQLVFIEGTALVLADADARSRRVIFADDAHWGAAWSFPPVPP